jgi:hypothetical protein
MVKVFSGGNDLLKGMAYCLRPNIKACSRSNYSVERQHPWFMDAISGSCLSRIDLSHE